MTALLTLAKDISSAFLIIFKHRGPHGDHTCLVREATGPDLARCQRRFPEAQTPVPMVRQIAKQLLLALDYLHRSCIIEIVIGNIKGIPAMSGFSLDGFIENKSFHSVQEKKDFVQFLQSMLVLAPEERKLAHLLVEESWLNKEYRWNLLS